MPPSTSAARQGLEPTEPQKQDVQFRDDGYILVNMLPDTVSARTLGVLSGISSIVHVLGDPIDTTLSILLFLGDPIDRLGHILERGDLLLARQTQDISEFITKCLRFARKKFGLQVERQEPLDLGGGSGHAQPIVSFPPKSHAGPSVPHQIKSWGSAKIIFPRGSAIDGSEQFTYRLVCVKAGKTFRVIHLACTPDMDDIEFVDMLRLIRMESSPLTSIRRILLGETVDIKFVEFEQFDADMVDIKKVDQLPPPHRQDWEYWPRPPSIFPPIGTYIFRHLYYHPEKHRLTNFLLKRIPMRADLLANQGPKSEIGYGLLLVASRSGAKQAWSLTILVLGGLCMFRMLGLIRELLWFSPSPVYTISPLIDIAFILVVSGFLPTTYNVFVIRGLADLRGISAQFPWVRRIIKYTTLCFSFPSRKAIRSGDSQTGSQTAKKVEWVNIHGTIIRDKYFELVPGAIQRLISELPNNHAASTSSGSAKAARQTLASIGRRLSKLSKEAIRTLSRLSGSTPSQGDLELDQVAAPNVSFGPEDSRNVLLCISSLRPSHHKTIVRIVNTINIEDDEKLFCAFRNEYKHFVGRLRWWFSMRTIVDIRFVHFEADRRALAHIKHYSRDDKKELDALPPESHHDYHYLPKPIELIPPLNRNTLLEFWHSPENCTGTKAGLRRIPTYRLCKIPLRHDDELGEAWGIEVIEGRKWEIFWYIAGLVFASSFVFAVAWGVTHHSLSDAFSVSSFLQTSFAIAVGLATLSASVDYLS